MLVNAIARLRAAWVALTQPTIPAPAYVPALPYDAPVLVELPEFADEAAEPPVDIRADYAARRDPALDAINAKPNATVADWRQWYEGWGWPDIPMTHSQIADVRATIMRDLQCGDLADEDVMGPRGMFRPVHRGVSDRDTRYRYRAAGAEDADDLDGTTKRLLAFLATRARPVSGQVAARALGVHHSNVSRAKDRLLARGLIVEEKFKREVLISVPRRSLAATADRARRVG